jgi:MFS superfamily sulfate permease-like transporter
VAVAAYLVPLVMVYARVAGVPAVAGLWATQPALVIYAVFGSSRSLSLGLEATTALMTAAAIGPLSAGGTARYAALASVLALLVGAMAVVAGLLRLGFVADLLPRPGLVGNWPPRPHLARPPARSARRRSRRRRPRTLSAGSPV